MRPYLLLIISTIIMAFASGYFTFFFKDPRTPSTLDILEINQTKVNFQKDVTPQGIINFSAIYNTSELMKLLDPLSTFSDLDIKNRSHFSTSKNCFKELPFFLNHLEFQKVVIWEEYRCNIRSFLPVNFFESPPYMHPAGISFARLAYLTKSKEFRKKRWLRDNLIYFHSLELPKIDSIWKDRIFIYSFLSKLDSPALNSLINGQGTIFVKDLMLARLTYKNHPTMLEYRIYSINSLNEYLKNTPFIISPYKTKDRCFFKDGNICWNYNIKHLFKRSNKFQLVIFAAFIFLLTLTVILLISKIKEQRKEEQRKRLALQVLTHEFRTPIAALVVLLENIQKDFNSLPESTMENFLRITEEVYRLKRMAEMSRNYLKVANNNKILSTQCEKIPSMLDYLDNIINPYTERFPGQISIDKDSEDFALTTDPYWQSICLTNLLENAFTHGSPPVVIKTRVLKKTYQIEIQDSGKSNVEDLNIIKQEFRRGNSGNGIGLGLHIVHIVIKELNACLELKKSPTRFIISYKKKE
jgi:signal transduction histidine kinase